ncbi:1-acyl-sn-glycerol-3-phosphate acyltransferase [Endozoicomonadaceae bacterium StTr2]
MSSFDAIRPYHDSEVQTVLQRLLQDREFILAMVRYSAAAPYIGKLPEDELVKLVHKELETAFAEIHDVHSVQQKLEPLLAQLLQQTTEAVTFSGLEHVPADRPVLFISNHRDIVLDPALVNWGLFRNERETVRIAIGDNLLERPFVNDLMRLNKSFVVERSITARRERLASLTNLSAYINHSLKQDHSSVWIAQSEGRAKDGDDRTDTAIIKMITMSQRKAGPFPEVIEGLNIVPVAISYEYDPCDLLKSRELYATKNEGGYTKQEGEDMRSIMTGLEGQKGRVHVAFGETLEPGLETAQAVTAAIDRQIHTIYRLFPVNVLACQKLMPELDVSSLLNDFSAEELSKATEQLELRLQNTLEKKHPIMLDMYARPVINYLAATNN